MSGLELSRRFYLDVVGPMLDHALPSLRYSAARLGPGSEVLGLDDEMSRDHDWGPQLTVFVDPETVGKVLAHMDARLPASFAGQPVRFATSHDQMVRHRVAVRTLDQFFDAVLGFDPRDNITTADWLSLTGQAALEVTAGDVYVDATGGLTLARERLRWPPRDVWAWSVACDWQRLAQELPLMGRAGWRGDELGARAIAGRLVAVAMHLGFMLEQQWPPYAKWLGTVYARLPRAGRMRFPPDRGGIDNEDRDAREAEEVRPGVP